MSRKELVLSAERIQPFDLENLREKAAELNQKNQQTYTTPFPKAPSRWLSHYRFTPRPVEFTAEGEVEGRMSALMGSLFDFSFVRAIFAPHYKKEGGPCFDPAGLFLLELAVKVDGYADYAGFCRDLRQQELGCRYRELAGLHDRIPGEDDLSNFRKKVGSQTMDSLFTVFVGFFQDFGLIKGELLSTDGQLEPSDSRYKGCAYFCENCLRFPLKETDRQELYRQLQEGSKQLQILCPFPEAVDKVLRATAKKGSPREPKVSLMKVEYLPAGAASRDDRRQLAQLLGLPPEQIPSVRIQGSRLQRDPQGELWASCPKVPSDLDARLGCHVDNKNPGKKEFVFGYNHIRTTDRNKELDIELPVGHSTHPANVDEGHLFQEHRSKISLPVVPGQVQLGDGGYDHTEVYEWILGRGGTPIIKYNPRNENRSPEALLERGYDIHGIPYAPCGRLCRSNGYTYSCNSRQYVCGLPCPSEERKHCPHGQKAQGYSQRMSVKEHPRLIGPIQRGSEDWKILYAARSASERTNSYDQEVLCKGRTPRLRGLKAFRFSGAIRTLAQLLRRALDFVLDVTYTLEKRQPAKA